MIMIIAVKITNQLTKVKTEIGLLAVFYHNKKLMGLLKVYKTEIVRIKTDQCRGMINLRLVTI